MGCCVLLFALFAYQGSLPYQKKRAAKKAEDLRISAKRALSGNFGANDAANGVENKV